MVFAGVLLVLQPHLSVAHYVPHTLVGNRATALLPGPAPPCIFLATLLIRPSVTSTSTKGGSSSMLGMPSMQLPLAPGVGFYTSFQQAVDVFPLLH